MNNLNEWIPHLQHPLVLAGFGLFVFALIIRLLFFNSKKLTGPVLVPLLNKAMILLFVLAVLVVIGGFALSWKATPAAAPKSAEKPVAAKGIEQYEQRLRVVEQRLLAMQASGAVMDDKGRHQLEQELKAVQGKLANVQKSWKEDQQHYQSAKRIVKELLKVLLIPDAKIEELMSSLEEGDPETLERVLDSVASIAKVNSISNTDDYYGLTEEKFLVLLKQRHESVTRELQDDSASFKERYVLKMIIKDINEKMENLHNSYIEEVNHRKDADELLSRMKDHLPDNLIENASKSLQAGDTEAAEQLFEAAANREGVITALAAYRIGQLAEARQDYTKAMRMYGTAVLLEKDNPDYLLAAGKLACTVADYDRAQEWLERLLKMREVEGKEDVKLATVLNELAELYYFQGRYAEAEPLYQRAIAIMQAKFPNGHPDLDLYQKNYDELKRKMAGQ